MRSVRSSAGRRVQPSARLGWRPKTAPPRHRVHSFPSRTISRHRASGLAGQWPSCRRRLTEASTSKLGWPAHVPVPSWIHAGCQCHPCALVSIVGLLSTMPLHPVALLPCRPSLRTCRRGQPSSVTKGHSATISAMCEQLACYVACLSMF